jgi:hypothetical protein
MNRHVLVIANETAASKSVIAKLRERAAEGNPLVTVIAPVNQPTAGYVVYEDTRRASAGRRLDQTLSALRGAGIRANGMVVESEPVASVRDALAQLEPAVTEIVVSTHPKERSGWLRRNVVDSIRKVAGPVPVEHVVADMAAEEEKNVLVVANQTLVGEPLLNRIRERSKRGPTSFLVVAPQSNDYSAQREVERRLRRLIGELRAEGIDAHGQVAHPDPHTAAMQAVHDERTDEIIVSTFPGQRSGWLRRDLVERLRKDAGVPVDHVEVEPEGL